MNNSITVFKILCVLMAAFVFSGCNDEEDGISAKQAKRSISLMKGTYQGSANVSFFRGERIAEFDNATAVSDDSLSFEIPLKPIADIIADETVAAALLSKEKAEVKAGYEILQIDQDGAFVHFLLKPKTVVVPSENGTPEIKIIFSDIFGGDADCHNGNIVFNVSPQKVMMGDTELPFRQLVYHFEGIKQ